VFAVSCKTESCVRLLQEFIRQQVISKLEQEHKKTTIADQPRILIINTLSPSSMPIFAIRSQAEFGLEKG
jgi:hypothetical protein